MLKPALLLSAVMILGFTANPNPTASTNSGGSPQEGASAPAQTQVPAAAPEAASSTAKNPVKTTPESQAKAKRTYGFDCAMCHGATGNGKTDLANDMKLTLADWTDPKALAGKSDGDLFDMIRKGKDKMPAEEVARAKNDDVWNLVIYIRGMAKSESAAASPVAAQN